MKDNLRQWGKMSFFAPYLHPFFCNYHIIAKVIAFRFTLWYGAYVITRKGYQALKGDRMTWRTNRKMFRLAIELYSLRHSPRIVNIDKEVQKRSSTADPVTPSDWAVDFMGCLPDDQIKKTTIISHYKDDDRGSLSSRQRQAFGNTAKAFWQQVKQKGLDREGEFLLRLINGT